LIFVYFAAVALLLALAGYWVWRSARRKRWIRFALAILLVFLAVSGIVGGIASRFLTVVHYPVKWAASKPVRIALVTDLHLGFYKGDAWTQTLVESINREQPDLVLLDGDLTHRIPEDRLAAAFMPLGQIRAKYGVFAVLGNHDYGDPGLDLSLRLEGILRSVGIRVLHNQAVSLECLDLVGVDDLRVHRAMLAVALNDSDRARTVVLCHNPDLLIQPWPVGPVGAPDSPLQAGLWLFGHTHAGQMRLLGLESLYYNVAGPYTHGWYQTEYGPVYVSAGAGEVLFPLRLLSQPEVVILELSPK
jgi:predicted MPP superfamily phosphohydrolase